MQTNDLTVINGGKGLLGDGTLAWAETTPPETALAVRTPVAMPTLYQAEEDLAALLDTEDLVTPEQEQEFQLALTRQLEIAPLKRDSVASFIKSCEANAEFAQKEIGRLQSRKRIFENVAEQLRKYVVFIIEGLGVDARGKQRRLEGHHFTMSASALPAAVVIVNEAAIPAKYKEVNVTMPAEVWERLVGPNGLCELGVAVAYTVDRTAIKAVLTGPAISCPRCGGIGMVEGPADTPAQCPVCNGTCNVDPAVPGADLLVGRQTLVIR